MVPLPPLRDGGCALPICPFGRACLPLISDAPDCTCSPGRLWFWVVWASCPGAAAPISIHAPRVGRDQIGDLADLTTEAFQSTRPVWGATTQVPYSWCKPTFQSTRPVWGATPGCVFCGDADAFQSTRPVWGATLMLARCRFCLAISIHAPRVGRDERKVIQKSPPQISIHAPRVGRDQGWVRVWVSTHMISIHAPRVGRDPCT